MNAPAQDSSSPMYTQDDLKEILQKLIGKRPKQAPQTVSIAPVPVLVPVQERECANIEPVSSPSLKVEKVIEQKEKQNEKQNEKLNEIQNEKIDQLTSTLHQTEHKVAELEKELHSAKFHARSLEEAHHDKQDSKAKVLRLIGEKKELEDKITSLSCEKAALVAKLQGLVQKLASNEESHAELSKKMHEIASLLMEKTEELTKSQLAIREQTSASDALIKENSTLKVELETIKLNLKKEEEALQEAQLKLHDITNQLDVAKKNFSQEIAVSQACLIERSQALDEETKKNRLLSQEHLFAQKRLDEQENHLRLLEQHLARRVKECSLLSKQLEEQMDRYSSSQNSLGEQERKVKLLEASVAELKAQAEQSKIEHAQKTQAFTDEQTRLESKMQDLLRQRAQLDEENKALRQTQMRFEQIEKLIKQTQEIPSLEPTPQTSILHTPQITQDDIFGQNTAPKPAKRSLFE